MSAEDAMEQARLALIRDIDHPTDGGTAAVKSYMEKLDAIGFPFALDPHDVAEIIVDAQCARGDYEGCSPELESAYSHYRAFAEKALEGVRP